MFDTKLDEIEPIKRFNEELNGRVVDGQLPLNPVLSLC